MALLPSRQVERGAVRLAVDRSDQAPSHPGGEASTDPARPGLSKTDGIAPTQPFERRNPGVKAWLADVIARIAETPRTRLHELLP